MGLKSEESEDEKTKQTKTKTNSAMSSTVGFFSILNALPITQDVTGCFSQKCQALQRTGITEIKGQF